MELMLMTLIFYNLYKDIDDILHKNDVFRRISNILINILVLIAVFICLFR